MHTSIKHHNLLLIEVDLLRHIKRLLAFLQHEKNRKTCSSGPSSYSLQWRQIYIRTQQEIVDLKNLQSYVNIHITMYNCPHSGFQYTPPGSTVQPFFVGRDKPVRLLTLTVSACTSTRESLHSPQASEKWRSSSNATTSDNIVRGVAISARVSCGFLLSHVGF